MKLRLVNHFTRKNGEESHFGRHPIVLIGISSPFSLRAFVRSPAPPGPADEWNALGEKFCARKVKYLARLFSSLLLSFDRTARARKLKSFSGRSLRRRAAGPLFRRRRRRGRSDQITIEMESQRECQIVVPRTQRSAFSLSVLTTHLITSN